MSEYPPTYTEFPEVKPTAPLLESDLSPPDTEKLLEGCPLQPVTHQPPAQPKDAQAFVPHTPWHQDCNWNNRTATRTTLETEEKSYFKFATNAIYFKVVIALACISICFSLPVGLCAFCVALCAYSEFNDKKYNTALALSWIAAGLGIASVIMSIVAGVLFYKYYIAQMGGAGNNQYGG